MLIKHFVLFFLLFRQSGNKKTAFFICLSFISIVTVIVIEIGTELKVLSYIQQSLSHKVQQTELNLSLNDIETSLSKIQKKLVCYYAAPTTLEQSNQLYPNRIGNVMALCH